MSGRWNTKAAVCVSWVENAVHGTVRRNALGPFAVRAVIAGTPPVHVHQLMQLHMNRAMIRVS
jgi:hypothetical protein